MMIYKITLIVNMKIFLGDNMKTDHLLFGAAYYSEYLPYDRVEKDMEMMEKQA